MRRSVANNLNDISKDNPDVAVETATRWWSDDPNTRRLVRHGLRTLIKAGDPRALAVLGYIADSPVRLRALAIDPTEVRIGESVRFTADLEHPGDEQYDVFVDIVVHFVKANGRTSPKVFKGGERSIPAGETAVVSKKISVAQHSTRIHYPGTHRVDVQITGVAHRGGKFVIEAGDPLLADSLRST